MVVQACEHDQQRVSINLKGWAQGFSQVCDSEVLLQTLNPETFKNTKSDSKVTFGAPAKVTQKLLRNDSKVTKKVETVTFD